MIPLKAFSQTVTVRKDEPVQSIPPEYSHPAFVRQPDDTSNAHWTDPLPVDAGKRGHGHSPSCLRPSELSHVHVPSPAVRPTTMPAEHDSDAQAVL